MINIATLLLHLVISIVLMLYTTVTTIIRLVVPYQNRAKSVKGEVVLITGAGSGLGRLMASRFAKLGAKLILVDVNTEGNEQTAREVIADGGEAKTFTCDLSNREKIYEVADQIKKTCPEVTILVNNAGIVTGKKFLNASDAEIQRTMNVNTTAHFWLVKSFLPAMLEKNHGHVVTIASMAGIFGQAGLCDYCASKFAAVGFDESLRNELINLNKTGVKTTVVCPYFIKTGMFEGVKTDVIPYLEPDYVADKIIEAVLTNQKTLFLPRLMYILFFFKSFASVDLVESYISTHVMKTCHAMDSFVGRKKEN